MSFVNYQPPKEGLNRIKTEWREGAEPRVLSTTHDGGAAESLNRWLGAWCGQAKSESGMLQEPSTHISSIASLTRVSKRGHSRSQRTSNSASSVTGLPLVLEHFPSSSSPLGKTVPSGDIQFEFVLLVNMKSVKYSVQLYLTELFAAMEICVLSKMVAACSCGHWAPEMYRYKWRTNILIFI